ncbi:hypothetical protein HE1_00022 [Holospora elegans E1]|uniref:Uncharacterized protein n=2 Tax=Holospora TaxID=44747 RepID=A0A023DWE7_9PROT|nr:hypothetical protein HE1_00022 [Holospora elegans E1]
MKKEQIYQEIRERSPLGTGSALELLEALENFSTTELLKDLENLYQEWGALPKLYYTNKKEDINHIQQCESLFDFILHAIFYHEDPSVIPHLLKYVPSDDDEQDLVFMEDTASEPLCNGITEKNYFGESYIPVLLGCIHELVPRAMVNAESFFYDMVYDNFECFSETQPLIRNLYLAEKEPFIKLLEYSVQTTTEELEKAIKENKQKSIEVVQRALDRIQVIRQAFVKLHGL